MHLCAGGGLVFSSISHPAVGAEIRRFGQETLFGVRDAPGYSCLHPKRVPAPVVLELCQWDEGRGLTPSQTHETEFLTGLTPSLQQDHA